MVNTLRNGEIAIMNWTDIDKPTKGYHFKDLNGEPNTKKFVALETSCNAPIEVANTNVPRNEKSMMLERTLYDIIVNNKVKLFDEAESGNVNDETWKSFSQSNQWQTFKKQAMILSSFLSTSKEEIDAAIQNLEKIFKGLGSKNAKQGEDPVEVGFKKLNDVGQELQKSNLVSVNPPIDQTNFIQLIQDRWESIEDSSLFMDMILTRKKRSFAGLIGNKELPTLGDAIQFAFRSVSKNKGKMEKVIEIFKEIVRKDSYTKGKGGTNVGKAEIALAMFFGDCKLPDHGDIQMGEKLIEVKGAGGTVAPRIGQKDWLVSGPTKTTRWRDTAGNQVRSKSEMMRLLKELNVTEPLTLDNINSVLRQVDKNKGLGKKVGIDQVKIQSLKFAIVFGILFNSYVTKERISCFWLFNTMLDRATKDMSELLSTPIIQMDMKPASKEVQWDNAFQFLNNKNIDLIYKTRENNSGYTFSIDFV